MTEARINMYEGMFLFPQTATADMAAAVAHIESILSRAEAELVSICKWDERRLAYDIKGNKRGLYFECGRRSLANGISTIETLVIQRRVTTRGARLVIALLLSPPSERRWWVASGSA